MEHFVNCSRGYVCSKLHNEGDWEMEYFNNWSYCITVNFKWSILDNFNAEQSGLYKFICINPLDASVWSFWIMWSQFLTMSLAKKAMGISIICTVAFL